MEDNKKKGLALIIMEKMKKGKEKEETEDEDYSGDEGQDSSVEEMFDAFEKKDVSGFKEALNNFIQLCKE